MNFPPLTIFVTDEAGQREYVRNKDGAFELFQRPPEAPPIRCAICGTVCTYLPSEWVGIWRCGKHALDDIP